MITEFELQSGEGTNVEIIGKGDDQLWLVVDEDALVKMIQLAFDAPKFRTDHLIDALRAAENAVSGQSALNTEGK